MVDAPGCPAQDGRCEFGLGCPGCLLLSPYGTRPILALLADPTVKPDRRGGEGFELENKPPILRKGFRFPNHPHFFARSTGGETAPIRPAFAIPGRGAGSGNVASGGMGEGSAGNGSSGDQAR